MCVCVKKVQECVRIHRVWVAQGQWCCAARSPTRGSLRHPARSATVVEGPSASGKRQYWLWTLSHPIPPPPPTQSLIHSLTWIRKQELTTLWDFEEAILHTKLPLSMDAEPLAAGGWQAGGAVPTPTRTTAEAPEPAKQHSGVVWTRPLASVSRPDQDCLAYPAYYTPPPFVIATQKSQINTVPTPTVAWTQP